MAEFDSLISIDNFIQSKDSNYITKTISLDNNIKIDTPFKIINISKFQLNNENKNIIGKDIVETTRYVNQKQSYDSLYNILEKPDTTQKPKLNQFFKINNLFKLYKSTISLSFSKNPFTSNKFKNGKTKPLTYSNFEYLLDYIYEFSTIFVLIPDIGFESFEEYKKYIENAVNTVSLSNNKPIFVPLSMKLNNKLIRDLLFFYKEKNYSNIWFNFNSTQINTKISNIRFS